ncbi:single-stranded-DNA-specific exonuclease [Helicobacter ailurogastricus]|uniref:single-stranded-DNA-specific exonuclease n=1 Tax=Helicobacter ailurogastricus TaxID=1578720 RepID=UPI000CF1C6AC|nr:single-stranded-DNA-specific exonuclease [Helicobacter ailurogastricus]GLH57421.1 hypothetical protein NHP214376_02080 [Helicobacter ailurogastricus]GLH58793.1 hypothetical protein NHP214377_00570 [Helicobacter ailurogastricus]GMB90976.1 hypothetical protein NHP190009_01410 [Helicobacter ailurogastricus]
MLFKAQSLEVFFSPEFLELYAKGEPYGVGNPTPLFEVCAPLKSWRFLGRTGQHIELILEDRTALLVCKWWFCPPKHHIHFCPPNSLCLVGEFDPFDKELKCLEIKL